MHGIQARHLLIRHQAYPLTGAELLCVLLWLSWVFVHVCAGGVTSAARRERHIGEPAQQQLIRSAWKSAIVATRRAGMRLGQSDRTSCIAGRIR